MWMIPGPADWGAWLFFTVMGGAWGICLWVNQEWPDLKAYVLMAIVAVSLGGWVWTILM